MNSGSIWMGVVLLCIAGAYAGYKIGAGDQGATTVLQQIDPAEERPAEAGKRRRPSKDTARLSATEVTELLIAAAQRRDREAWSSLRGSLPNLPQEELVQVMEGLGAMKSSASRQEAIWPVLSALAKLDPPLALEQAQRFLEGHRLDQAEGMVLKEWARLNPAVALKKAEELAGASNVGGSTHYHAVMSVWARDDFPGAATALAGLDDARAQDVAVRALARVAGGADVMRSRLLEIANNLDSQRLRESFVAEGVRAWGMNGDLDEVAEWIDAQELETEFRARLRRAVAQGAAYQNPKRTAQWLMERSTAASRAIDLDTIVGTWANREPQACGKWLKEQAEGPVADQAIGTYTEHLSRRDPQEALAWASRIHDDRIQMRSYERIVHSMGPVPIGRVRSDLEKAGLSEELVEKLLESRDVE